MKKLELTQGQFALVDDEDFDELNRYSWSAFYSPLSKTYYAKRKREGRSVVLQRQIMKAKKRQRVDAINGDTLDCRKENLRVGSVSQITAGAAIPKTNKTGYKGVIRPNGRHRWRTCIRVNGKNIHGGSYDTAEEAARAYDTLARKHFGEFARLNFSQEVASKEASNITVV